VLRLNPAIDALVPADAAIELLDDQPFRYLEGPLWVNEGGGYLLFSDVPAGIIYKWTPPGGKSTEFLKVGGPNGLTLDAGRRLVICEEGAGRRVSRVALTGGEPEVVADSYEGKRLNSPNDLVYHPDGSLYFTDPPFGLKGQDESPDKELDFNGVFRLSPGGELTVIANDLERPNGIAVSPDGKILYVADAQRKRWMAYDLASDGTASNERLFFDASGLEGKGSADGMKLDTNGNLYCTGPGGVLIFTPTGVHLGTIQPPQTPSNIAWGGSGADTLYMTAPQQGLYRIRLSVKGLLPPGQ
jgi:gluconolactonase